MAKDIRITLKADETAYIEKTVVKREPINVEALQDEIAELELKLSFIQADINTKKSKLNSVIIVKND